MQTEYNRISLSITKAIAKEIAREFSKGTVMEILNAICYKELPNESPKKFNEKFS